MRFMLLGCALFMVLGMSSMGVVMALYVENIIPFCFPNVVDVSALRICIALREFVIVWSILLLYVSFGSRLSPNICRLCSWEV